MKGKGSKHAKSNTDSENTILVIDTMKIPGETPYKETYRLRS